MLSSPASGDSFLHLNIVRLDSATRKGSLHMRRIKNELAGAEHGAIEILPAESLLVDCANEYHLWVQKGSHVSFSGRVERWRCACWRLQACRTVVASGFATRKSLTFRQGDPLLCMSFATGAHFVCGTGHESHQHYSRRGSSWKFGFD